uniref:DOCKER domain-containing protein n=2 Tax=Phaeomonas parva TaxID=124430 RepID=A0A7S1XP40_9STRA|mmetsp:Transcript_20727/g.63064  ORF Transcript_20727/g.63064 Transcript_20727/m.63064 type:complete len:102 (+) Transcript_20727:102-407(+)
MALQGVVDAAVNGGLANYEVFFTGAYQETNPEIHADIVENPEKGRCRGELFEALEQQLAITTEGLQVHARKCDEATRPLHDYMMEKFATLKSEMEKLLAMK